MFDAFNRKFVPLSTTDEYHKHIGAYSQIQRSGFIKIQYHDYEPFFKLSPERIFTETDAVPASFRVSTAELGDDGVPFESDERTEDTPPKLSKLTYSEDYLRLEQLVLEYVKVCHRDHSFFGQTGFTGLKEYPLTFEGNVLVLDQRFEHFLCDVFFLQLCGVGRRSHKPQLDVAVFNDVITSLIRSRGDIGLSWLARAFQLDDRKYFVNATRNSEFESLFKVDEFSDLHIPNTGVGAPYSSFPAYLEHYNFKDLLEAFLSTKTLIRDRSKSDSKNIADYWILSRMQLQLALKYSYRPRVRSVVEMYVASIRELVSIVGMDQVSKSYPFYMFQSLFKKYGFWPWIEGRDGFLILETDLPIQFPLLYGVMVQTLNHWIIGNYNLDQVNFITSIHMKWVKCGFSNSHLKCKGARPLLALLLSEGITGQVPTYSDDSIYPVITGYRDIHVNEPLYATYQKKLDDKLSDDKTGTLQSMVTFCKAQVKLMLSGSKNQVSEYRRFLVMMGCLFNPGEFVIGYPECTFDKSGRTLYPYYPQTAVTYARPGDSNAIHMYGNPDQHIPQIAYAPQWQVWREEFDALFKDVIDEFSRKRELDLEIEFVTNLTSKSGADSVYDFEERVSEMVKRTRYVSDSDVSEVLRDEAFINGLKKKRITSFLITDDLYKDRAKFDDLLNSICVLGERHAVDRRPRSIYVLINSMQVSTLPVLLVSEHIMSRTDMFVSGLTKNDFTDLGAMLKATTSKNKYISSCDIAGADTTTHINKIQAVVNAISPAYARYEKSYFSFKSGPGKASAPVEAMNRGIARLANNVFQSPKKRIGVAMKVTLNSLPSGAFLTTPTHNLLYSPINSLIRRTLINVMIYESSSKEILYSHSGPLNIHESLGPLGVPKAQAKLASHENPKLLGTYSSTVKFKVSGDDISLVFTARDRSEFPVEYYQMVSHVITNTYRIFGYDVDPEISLCQGVFLQQKVFGGGVVGQPDRLSTVFAERSEGRLRFPMQHYREVKNVLHQFIGRSNNPSKGSFITSSIFNILRFMRVPNRIGRNISIHLDDSDELIYTIYPMSAMGHPGLGEDTYYPITSSNFYGVPSPFGLPGSIYYSLIIKEVQAILGYFFDLKNSDDDSRGYTTSDYQLIQSRLPAPQMDVFITSVTAKFMSYNPEVALNEVLSLSSNPNPNEKYLKSPSHAKLIHSMKQKVRSYLYQNKQYKSVAAKAILESLSIPLRDDWSYSGIREKRVKDVILTADVPSVESDPYMDEFFSLFNKKKGYTFHGAKVKALTLNFRFIPLHEVHTTSSFLRPTLKDMCTSHSVIADLNTYFETLNMGVVEYSNSQRDPDVLILLSIFGLPKPGSSHVTRYTLSSVPDPEDYVEFVQRHFNHKDHIYDYSGLPTNVRNQVNSVLQQAQPVPQDLRIKSIYGNQTHYYVHMSGRPSNAPVVMPSGDLEKLRQLISLYPIYGLGRCVLDPA